MLVYIYHRDSTSIIRYMYVKYGCDMINVISTTTETLPCTHSTTMASSVKSHSHKENCSAVTSMNYSKRLTQTAGLHRPVL